MENIYNTILKYFPPKETVELTILLIEENLELISNYFKDIKIKIIDDLNKLKNEKKLQNNENQNISIELISNKKKNLHYILDIELSIGKFYKNFMEQYGLPQELKNKNIIFSYEIVFKEQKTALNLYEIIKKNILSKIDEFPYVKSYKSIGGEVKIINDNNKIIIYLSRNSEKIKNFLTLFNLEEFSFFENGVNSHIYISNAYDNVQTYHTISEYIEQFISFIIKININLINYKQILRIISNRLEEKQNPEFMKNISKIIRNLLCIKKADFSLEYNLDTEFVINFLIKYIFRANVMLFQTIEDSIVEDKALQEFLKIIEKLFSDLGINIQKESIETIYSNIYFPYNKIKLNINFNKFIFVFSNLLKIILLIF